MKMLLFGFGLTVVLACAVNAVPQCHTSELTECMNIAIDWVHTFPKGAIPDSDQQIDTMCQEIGKTVDCGLKYRDSCMTQLQKEVIGLLFEGAFEFRKDFCSPGSALRTSYLTHAPCLNKVFQSDVAKEQIEYILAVVENSAKQEINDRIMYTCCGYRKMHGEMSKIATDNCGVESTNTMYDIMYVITGQLMDTICTSMDGTDDSCQAILPPAGFKVTDDAKSTQLYQFLKNILNN